MKKKSFTMKTVRVSGTLLGLVSVVLKNTLNRLDNDKKTGQTSQTDTFYTIKLDKNKSPFSSY